MPVENKRKKRKLEIDIEDSYEEKTRLAKEQHVEEENAENTEKILLPNEIMVFVGASIRQGHFVLFSSDGYKFHLNRERKKLIWFCSEYKQQKCKVTLKTDPIQFDYGQIAREGSDSYKIFAEHNCAQHSHDPVFNLREKNDTMMKYKINCVDQKKVPLNDLITSAKEFAEDDEDMLLTLPNNHAMRRTGYRVRKPCKGKLDAENVNDIVFPHSFIGHVLYDSGIIKNQRRFFILGTDAGLELLKSNGNVWSADGTFAITPRTPGFKQVFTIALAYKHKSFPLIYALLHSKKKPAYLAVFKVLKELIGNDESKYPRKVICDFERGIFSAFKTVFPNGEVQGCYFHLVQSMFRRMQKLGIAPNYSAYKHVRQMFRLLMALPFLPEEDVRRGFHIVILQQPDNRMSRLFYFFGKYYIGLTREQKQSGFVAFTSHGAAEMLPYAEEIVKSPMFPISYWNVNNAVKSKIMRTNNSLEAAHLALQKRIPHHPQLSVFLPEFIQYEKNQRCEAADAILHGVKRKFSARCLDYNIADIVKTATDLRGIIPEDQLDNFLFTLLRDISNASHAFYQAMPHMYEVDNKDDEMADSEDDDDDYTKGRIDATSILNSTNESYIEERRKNRSEGNESMEEPSNGSEDEYRSDESEDEVSSDESEDEVSTGKEIIEKNIEENMNNAIDEVAKVGEMVQEVNSGGMDEQENVEQQQALSERPPIILRIPNPRFSAKYESNEVNESKFTT